jgi:hypothetical protein
MQEPVVFVFAELEALSVRFRNKPLNLVKKCVATSLLYLESDFAHGVKSGSSSVASMQRRHKLKLELRNSGQALDLRLGAVLYVHNQTLLSLREDAEGIVKLSKGWSISADGSSALFLRNFQ